MLLLSMPFCLPAQKASLDTLLPLLPLQKTLAEHASVQIDIADAYLTVNPDSTIYYAQQCLESAHKLSDKKLEGKAYRAMGEAYNYTNQQIIAIDYLLRAQQISEECGDFENLADIHFAFGELHTIMKQYAKARKYFNKALVYYTAVNNEDITSGIYGCIGDNFFQEQQYDSALYYSNKALALGRKTHTANNISYALSTIADVLIVQKRIADAEGYLNESYYLIQQLGDDYSLAYIKGQYAKIALGRNDFNRALQLSDEIETYSKELGMSDLRLDVNELRYKIYKQMGKNDMALVYLEAYRLLSDTLNNKSKYAAADSLLEKHMLEKSKQEIALLKEKNHANLVYLMAAVIALALAMALIISIYLRSNERKKMFSTLQAQRNEIQLQAEKLQDINQLKDRMFSIISHDLRGPVSSLKSLIDFMKSNSLSSEESELMVNELKKSVNSVDMLLENLLVWAQLQIRGDIPTKIERLSLKPVVDEVIQLYSKNAAQKNIGLISSVDDDIHVMADNTYLSLILRNLVNNAIKFTPQHGNIEIFTEIKDDTIQLCVKDNGIGMSAEEIDQLFQLQKPFIRLGTQQEKGSGLGLLFVKEYTERGGGKFTIFSVKGTGSTFCVSFRIA